MHRLRWYCWAILNGGQFGDLRTIYQGCRALPFALAGLSCSGSVEKFFWANMAQPPRKNWPIRLRSKYLKSSTRCQKSLIIISHDNTKTLRDLVRTIRTEWHQLTIITTPRREKFWTLKRTIGCILWLDYNCSFKTHRNTIYSWPIIVNQTVNNITSQ